MKTKPENKVQNEVVEENQNLTKVEAAQNEVEKLKALMDEAKKKLAEAKKANQKSRPVRLSTFTLTVVDSRDSKSEGQFITKSDVHYVAEKAGIDLLVESLKANEANNSSVYRIYKTQKADPNKSLLVSQLYVDWETRQIVID